MTKQEMADDAILSHRIDVNELPLAGLDTDVVASDDQRAALAEAYGLPAVNALSAEVTVMPSGIGVTVSGRVKADIVQSCVVTLEPVAQHIDETFSVRFVPADSREAAVPAREVVVDVADDSDPPEEMDGTSIDIGALVEEIFVLAIDPYPRAPGATLDVPEDDDGEGTADSPFAVLRERKGEGA